MMAILCVPDMAYTHQHSFKIARITKIEIFTQVLKFDVYCTNELTFKIIKNCNYYCNDIYINTNGLCGRQTTKMKKKIKKYIFQYREQGRCRRRRASCDLKLYTRLLCYVRKRFLRWVIK